MTKILVACAIVIICALIGIAVTCGFVYVLSWCFGFKFSLKLAIGIYVAFVFLKTMFNKSK